jgi:hypothetical protein
MLELFYKINSKATIKVDGKTPQEVFENLATMMGVFSIQKCGACGSDEIKYVSRKAQGEKNKIYNYLECWCDKCFSRLSFGISDNGQIYPKVKLSQLAVEKSESDKKRFEENEAYAKKNYGNLMNGGWHKYKTEKPVQKQEAQQPVIEEKEVETPF